jgi:hypothetical protein
MIIHAPRRRRKRRREVRETPPIGNVLLGDRGPGLMGTETKYGISAKYGVSVLKKVTAPCWRRRPSDG